ncbi:DUF5381 family protein [Metabacillus litoralis]|uniref:DUF5381 family protein n=1 Tax=Metabacillus litoralis TaxID=152268 RepID=UPI001CFD8F40|nr:DUF5381 family protein [Metabacillus litoralis]
MLNVFSENENVINIKGSKFMYGWILLALFAGVFSCLFLIYHGLKFDSSYSLFYLGGGIMCLPFFLYVSLWTLPGLIPGKILLTISQGKNGTIKSKKGTVFITNIRNIDLVRNPLNLINEIIIETFDNRVIKIRTYNLIDDLAYQMMVDQYIYPYMTENSRKVWDRKVDLEQLKRIAKYERTEKEV